MNEEFHSKPGSVAIALRRPKLDSWRTIISAMIPPDLLELLVCPACRKPLVLKVNPEALKCTACQRVYPVRDNIPILLIDEATTEPS